MAVLILLLFSGCGTSQSATSSEPLQPHMDPHTPPDTGPSDRPSGVPAVPHTIEYELPDGYILKIRLKGDEHGHIATTEDGYRLIMNPEGYYEYALMDDQGLPQATGIIARNKEDRTEEHWRIIGNPQHNH